MTQPEHDTPDALRSTRLFHGTRAAFEPGDLIEPRPHDMAGPERSTGVYCTGDLDAALWEAELAAGDGPGRVYAVEPLGQLEDASDEPGRQAPHPMMTLRSVKPLRVTGELTAFPLYHGTRAQLEPGDLIEAGHAANFGSSPRDANYVYAAQTLDAAVWGAELAAGDGAGRIYVVEPTGPIEADPNLTNQRFRGNPTRSFRSRSPLRVVGEVRDWGGHAPDAVRAMKEGLEQLSRKGIEAMDE
jgi:hypothetical protein